MKSEQSHWTKEELKVYILLLCAMADSVKAEDEIQLIKTKTSEEIFDKINREFQNDNEDESLKKIEEAIEWHQYSEIELCKLKNEIQ